MRRTVQRFRGGYAVAFYKDGRRAGRSTLKSTTFEGAKIEAETVTFQARAPIEQSVYFAKLINDDGFIKIGIARNAAGRRGQLLVGLPYDLEILRVCPGGLPLERRLHRRLAADRIRGEWFRPTEAVIQAMEETPGSCPTTAAPKRIAGEYLYRAVMQQLDITLKMDREGAEVPGEPVPQRARR